MSKIIDSYGTLAKHVVPHPLQGLIQEVTEIEDSVCYRRSSDVALLFNTERIKNYLGEEGFLNLVKSMSPKDSVYRSGKFSDEALLVYTKSRYDQAPAEIRAWLDSVISDGNAYLSALAVNQQVAQEEAQRASETPSSSSE